MAKTTTANYVITNAEDHLQPAAGAPKAERKATDGFLRIDGTVTKNGKPQTTKHIILKVRQMAEYKATMRQNGNKRTFSLTEARAGRGKSAPSTAEAVAKALADI